MGQNILCRSQKLYKGRLLPSLFFFEPLADNYSERFLEYYFPLRFLKEKVTQTFAILFSHICAILLCFFPFGKIVRLPGARIFIIPHFQQFVKRKVAQILNFLFSHFCAFYLLHFLYCYGIL